MKSLTRLGRLACLCAGMALFVAGQAHADSFSFRKIALEGEPAPGGAGVYSTFYSGLAINNAGDSGIIVALNGNPSDQAVFVIRNDGSHQSVRSTDPPPPALGGSYSYLGAPSLNDLGDFVFHVGHSSTNAWLIDSAAGLDVIASVGDPVPGVSGSTYDDNPDSVSIDDAGRILLGALLDNPAGDQTALFQIDSSGVDVVAIRGDAAPTPTPSLFTVIQPDASINAAGTIAFWANTDLTTQVGSRGVFARQSGTLIPIALEREVAPVGVGRTFSFASDPTPKINAAGKVVFYAFLKPSAATANQGIFLHDGIAIQALVLSDDPVPDAPGRTFSTFARPHIGDADVVTFLAYSYDGQNNLIQGLYRLRDGVLTTIVETGDPLPGVGAATLDGLSYWSLAVNDSGAVLFEATLSDGRTGDFQATPNPLGVPSLGPGALGMLALAMAALGLRRAHGSS